MKILHLDSNHSILIEKLTAAGFQNDEDYKSSKSEIEQKIHLYDGIILRSRLAIDKSFLEKATHLKFIGRVGAGLENIDCQFAENQGITLISSPEGNRNAVGEHTLGMLLSLLNKFKKANIEIKGRKWLREENRGEELDYKTIGIIGYGNMGKSFAKKLRGFDCKVICYDIKPDVGDQNATQVSLNQLFTETDVLSLHTPENPSTLKMINADFINSFKKPFWFLNTARGKSVVTDDLVQALKNGKILGAGLDVLEYEKASFEDFFSGSLPPSFEYLLNAQNVILTPHIAGWTHQSKVKLAEVIADKIIANFKK